MYRPKVLTHQNFFLKSETVADVYGVESDIIRLDDRIKFSPCADAVRKTLIRADGLSTLLIDGVYIDIYTLMRIEAADPILVSAQSTNDALRSLLCEENLNTFEDALKVYRFMQTVDRIQNPQEKTPIKSSQDILDLYARSLYGPTLQGPKPSFRSRSYVFEADNRAKELYEPTDSNELIVLMDDLCSFLNKNAMSPLAQASIAQFQFEALKPFDENLDRMERLIMHYVLYRRKLVESIVFPLNLFSAHFKDRFYQMFEPYLNTSESLDENTDLSQEELIVYSVKVAQELAQFTVSLHNMIRALIERWRTNLGRVEKGSALELLLYQFAGNPIMTISHGAATIGKSFSTTSEAFDRLVKAGILRQGKSIHRNKTFEAPDALFLHEGMYRKKAITFEEFTA